jgi:predicted phage terminase large subunit-like protein
VNIELARETPLGLLLYTHPTYKSAPHLELLNAAIMETMFGPPESRRLIVCEPPRHAKSTMTSIAAPAWYLGRRPNDHLIGATHTNRLSKRFGRKVRTLIDVFGHETFDIELSSESAAADEFGIAGYDGGMLWTSPEGGVTGYGGNGILIDDPVKDAEAGHSETQMERLWEWLRETLEPRAEPDAWWILTMTRWSERDPVGRIIEEAPEGWRVLRLPALAEGDDPLGRAEGEALWPGRWSRDALLRKRSKMTSYAWAAEYQQRPAPEEGGIIKKAWIQRFTRLPVGTDRGVISWDLKLKETSTGSFHAGQAWYGKGADVYLDDQARGRWGFEETLDEAAALAARHPGIGRRVFEDAAMGPAAVAMLRRRLTGVVLRKVKGEGRGPSDKAARLRAVAPVFEGLNVHVPGPGHPRYGRWVEDWIHELTTFPGSANDDQVDATSQALAELELHAETSASGAAAERRERGEVQRRPVGPSGARPRSRFDVARGPGSVFGGDRGFSLGRAERRGRLPG